jgi:hypothetical protein
MYFTSDRPGDQGERDIWIMKKLPSGEGIELIETTVNNK